MQAGNRTNKGRARVFAFSLPLIAVLGGCAGMDRRAEPVETDQARLVARDFVSALTQLRGFTPTNTMLQVRPPATPFGEELTDELRRAGFGLQMVAEDDSGPLLVSYDAKAFEADDAGRSVGYRLRVGAIELGREYEVRGGRVFPMTALSVRGTRISESPLDNAIFDRNVAAEARTAEPMPEQEPGRVDGTDGVDPPMEPSILLPPLDDNRSQAGWQEVSDSGGLQNDAVTSRASRPEIPRADPDRPATVPPARGQAPIEWGPQDVLSLGGESFAAVADGYEIEEQEVLMFSDDSTRLRKANRPRLESLVSSFDPATEVITVLGASHGPTGMPGRNRALAIGRADRIRVELLALGLDPDKVIEGGSWSTEKSPGLDRGVIVSVHRRLDPKSEAELNDPQNT